MRCHLLIGSSSVYRKLWFCSSRFTLLKNKSSTSQRVSGHSDPLLAKKKKKNIYTNVLMLSLVAVYIFLNTAGTQLNVGSFCDSFHTFLCIFLKNLFILLEFHIVYFEHISASLPSPPCSENDNHTIQLFFLCPPFPSLPCLLSSLSSVCVA